LQHILGVSRIAGDAVCGAHHGAMVGLKKSSQLSELPGGSRR
jgi:hypothetical protein